jgi:hypothetical protein
MVPGISRARKTSRTFSFFLLFVSSAANTFAECTALIVASTFLVTLVGPKLGSAEERGFAGASRVRRNWLVRLETRGLTVGTTATRVARSGG